MPLLRYAPTMQPADTCLNYLGGERVAEILEGLSSPQIKAVLKEGGIKVKLPSGVITQKKKRQMWQSRILSAIQKGSDEAASEFLQQWLLNHQRPLLIAYLDALGVKHRAGETDDSFLFSISADRLREGAVGLFDQFPKDTVATYLVYIAHQQQANVFDDWEPLQKALLVPTPAEATDDLTPEEPNKVA